MLELRSYLLYQFSEALIIFLQPSVICVNCTLVLYLPYLQGLFTMAKVMGNLCLNITHVCSIQHNERCILY